MSCDDPYRDYDDVYCTPRTDSYYSDSSKKKARNENSADSCFGSANAVAIDPWIVLRRYVAVDLDTLPYGQGDLYIKRHASNVSYSLTTLTKQMNRSNVSGTAALDNSIKTNDNIKSLVLVMQRNVQDDEVCQQAYDILLKLCNGIDGVIDSFALYACMDTRVKKALEKLQGNMHVREAVVLALDKLRDLDV